MFQLFSQIYQVLFHLDQISLSFFQKTCVHQSDMLVLGFLMLTSTAKWFCNRVDIQYQIIHDKLQKVDHSLMNELKTIVCNYWEENHHHCFCE